MDLDPETLLIARVLPITIVSAVFATTSALRHNDAASRTWTAAFAAVLCSSGLDAIYAADGSVPAPVVAASQASAVFALGAMWAGGRMLNGRSRSWIGLAVLAALVVAAPTLLRSSDPDPDLALGTALQLGTAGLFAWLTATELLRGPMRTNLNARILQFVFFLLGGWFAIAAGLTAAAAAGSDIRDLDLLTTALPLTGVFLVSAICLSALRVERAGNWWSMSGETSRRTHLDVLAPDSFREDARDRIDRATLAGAHVGLVLAEIDHLDDLNTAFGRESGDRALVQFVQILRSRVPAEALIGHLGAGRFAILLLALRADVPQTVMDAIRTGLTDAPVADGMELRTAASFGTSHSSDTPASLDALLTRATADLERARANLGSQEPVKN
ncbi:GGDEF domain-containing protein [Aeromicrobium wangtongii]|uniref:GGDEF domain-containing protein n=1 Tax=Aeromicrobium wangtongii TaxID=2969247 RepID=UPI00201756D8|nr:GGDEF domain-containing protein [Aeromicrobium wangtongii]MCL3817833.1 GGDEF domain-containing protein [Aeromicrobium wangtongii]